MKNFKIPPIYGVILLLPFLISFLPLVNAQIFSNQHAEAIPEITMNLIAVEPDENTVLVGIWLINIFEYRYATGDYTMDMYIYFFWTNPDLTKVDWYFANGYPITPTSITLIESRNSTEENLKYQVFRATARFNTPPDASNYPLDDIYLTVSVDLLTHGRNLTLSWLNDQTGIDPSFQNSGWTTTNVELTTFTHSYPLGVEVPRAELAITQQKQRIGNVISPFIPPLIFSFVSAVSFLFGLKETGSVGLRIGLNTSMLVTTLLFSFGINANIPPSSSVPLYSIFLTAVLFFMVCNLVVTIVGTVGWVKYRNEKRTMRANQFGFLISIIVPITVFLLLFLTR